MYNVELWTTAAERMSGLGGYYVVTDRPANANVDGWPEAARFTISLRHDRELQRRRANEYCDYLNKVAQVQPPIGQVA